MFTIIKKLYISAFLVLAPSAGNMMEVGLVKEYLDKEAVNSAQFVVLGEVKSLELIESFQSEDNSRSRRMVKVGISVSAYWKPGELATRDISVYLNYPGDYGIVRIQLGYRYIVAGSIKDGMYYADSGSRAFYAYVNRVEKILGATDANDALVFEDKNLILVNSILGSAKLFE